MGHFQPMSNIGQRIKEARKSLGLSQEEFAAALSKQSARIISRGAIGNWELGKGISRDNLAEVARLCGVSIDWLQLNEPLKKTDKSSLFTTRQNSTGTANDIPQNAAKGGGVSITRKIPAFGQAMGGKNGAFVLNGNKIADVLAPPSLDGVPDAYAVFVVGDSMEPRYFAGEAVFVNPKLPVRKYDFVVVQIASVEGDPPLGYVKRFISKDDRRIRLEQFNPKKNLEFPSNKVVSVHRIIMGGDG